MTICAAGIGRDAIYVVSDCRVTYEGELLNPYSDCLLKTVPLTSNSFLCFAGDIACIQSMVGELNLGHAVRNIRSGSEFLSRISRQFRYAYGKHCMRTPKPVTQFLIGIAGPDCYWLGKSESPTFNMQSSRAIGGAFAIGDSTRGQEAAANSMRTALESNFPPDQIPMLAASFMDGGLSLLYPERYGDKAAERHGISSLFTLFRLDQSGLSALPYTIDMFRGRIADRNKPLGHARVNEVVFDPDTGKFTLVDHQSGQSNPLMDLRRFGSQRFGIVRTDFDPYRLKA